jgi:hypothetical protein
VEEPDAEGEEPGSLQQAGRLVQRGLLDHDLVALVEPAHLVDEDEQRHRRDHDDGRGVVGHLRQQDEDHDRRRDRVGEREAAAVQALADDRVRGGVAFGDQVVIETYLLRRPHQRHAPPKPPNAARSDLRRRFLLRC